MSGSGENAVLVPAWSIAIVTTGPADYADVKNALLYADNVYWLARECFIMLLQEKIQQMRSFLPDPLLRAKGIDPASVFAYIDSRSSTEREETKGMYERFERELDANGLRSVVTAPWGFDQVQGWLTSAWEFSGPDELSQLREQYPTAFKTLPDTREAIWLDLFQRFLAVDLHEATTRSTVFINPGTLRPSAWSAHARANLLMKALSRLVLPDVGGLPIEAIAELRDRLQDTLDPMRAEMLRLSEDLRKLGPNVGEDELLRESEELIATRVEPVVRMASARARELTKSKWRSFYVGLAKTFGFAGAGFLSPALLTKALEEALNTGAAIAGPKESSKEPAGASAAFVIEARRTLAEHLST